MENLPVKLLAVISVAALVTVSGCSGGTSIKGEKAPDFTVETIRGEEVTLSQFEGQVVIVDFMSSMCGYCYANGRVIKSILNSHPDVVVVSVNFGESSASKLTRPGATVQDYMNNIGVSPESYPNWYFGTEVVGKSKDELANQYCVRSTPALFLLDENGNVVRRDGVISQKYGESVNELD